MCARLCTPVCIYFCVALAVRDCSGPYAIPNGVYKTRSGSFNYSQPLFYTCDKNYAFSDGAREHQRDCQYPSYVWSTKDNLQPTCEEIVCSGSDPAINDTSVTLTPSTAVYSIDTSVTVACKDAKAELYAFRGSNPRSSSVAIKCVRASATTAKWIHSLSINPEGGRCIVPACEVDLATRFIETPQFAVATSLQCQRGFGATDCIYSKTYTCDWAPAGSGVRHRITPDLQSCIWLPCYFDSFYCNYDLGNGAVQGKAHLDAESDLVCNAGYGSSGPVTCGFDRQWRYKGQKKVAKCSRK